MSLFNNLSGMLGRAKRLAARGRKRPVTDQVTQSLRRIDAEQLEDRVLFNAAPFDMAALDSVEQLDDPQAMQDALESLVQTLDAQQDLVASLPAPPDAADIDESESEVDLDDEFAPADRAIEGEHREIVFIDRSVDDYETLVEDMQSSSKADRFDLVFIESEADGIEQITKALADRGSYDAMHIVSHGNGQGVRLGETWLSGSTLQHFQDDVASWGKSLTESGDLLFYGCELAESSEGRAFLESIGELTGADVGASDDATGQALLGGDWDLEYEVGDIDTVVAFSQQAQGDFEGLLATFTVTNTNDSGGG